MKLLNDLYTIVETQATDGNARVSIALNAEHRIYACHFPGNPITPGVCILQILSELVALHYDSSLAIKGYANVKYLSIISPLDHPTVDVEFSVSPRTDNGDVRVKAAFKSGGEVFVKISAIYE